MGQARFQKFFNDNIWNFEKRAESVNLENPYVPLNGFTLSEVLGGARPTQSGVLVTPEAAMRLSAVWRCVSILAGVISYLPSKPFRDTDKGRELAKDHSTYKLFTKRPSPLYTKSVFWERAIVHLLTWGNHYAKIITDPKSNEITRFDLIVPSQVKQITYVNGALIYELNSGDRVRGDEMIHVPHLGADPITGKSVITQAKEDIGIEISRRDTGAKFWADGGRPEGLLIPSQKLSPTQAAELKNNFREAKREGGTIAAPFGVTYVPISMNPADQEFIMSGNFSIASICRWFGVPLHKLSELDRATNNNIEHLAIEFLQDTIAPIVQKFEDEYSTKCYTLPSEEDMYLEFDMNAYQRADTVAQAEFYRTGIQNGFMSSDEIRGKINLTKTKGGDRLFIQQNMMPLDNVDQILAKKSSQPVAKNLKEMIRELATLAEQDYKVNGSH